MSSNRALSQVRGKFLRFLRQEFPVNDNELGRVLQLLKQILVDYESELVNRMSNCFGTFFFSLGILLFSHRPDIDSVR